MDDAGKEFQISEAVEFAKKYSWLAEFRILDFLTLDYWNQAFVPADWRVFAEKLDSEGYLRILLNLTDPQQTFLGPPFDFARQCYELSFIKWRPKSQSLSPPLKRDNVKLKKSYEIETLSTEMTKILEKEGVSMAVDIGAGQGYLAVELLQKCPFLQVVAVECSDIQVHGTTNRLEKLDQDIQNRFKVRQVYLSSDIPVEEFENLVLDENQRVSYLLYSLHACGSLSESMLQLFSSPICNAQILFNIGCCYNLIDEANSKEHFPMSKRVKSFWKESILTRNMKMLACQSPSRWSLHPSQTQNFMKRHFYRALFELMIKEHHLVGFGERIGRISDSALISFHDYCEVACRKLGLELKVDFEDYYLRHKRWEPILAFMWTIRALLGPVLEAIILYDRYEYVKEKLPNANVALMAMLDPLKSPRNMAIVATKHGGL